MIGYKILTIATGSVCGIMCVFVYCPEGLYKGSLWNTVKSQDRDDSIIFSQKCT